MRICDLSSDVCSSDLTEACCSPARCRRTAWRTGSAFACRLSATMRQRPVSHWPSCGTCPRQAKAFNMEAGDSTSSTWTDARSTNCSRSAPRFGLRSRTRRNPLRPEGSPYRLTLLVPEAAQDHADRAADDGQFDLPARIADVVQIIAYLGGDAPRAGGIAAADLGETGDAGAPRSGEHTSELQSLMRHTNSVCC